MRRILAAVLILLAAACQRRTAGEGATLRERAGSKGTLSPSRDGRLTEAQVRMYLEKKPGQNLDEDRWVAARIREARLAGSIGEVERRLIASRRQILRALEERRKTLADPAKKAEVDRQIVEVRNLLRNAPPEPPPAVAFNMELLARMEKRP